MFEETNVRKGLSRRDLLKGATLSAAGVAAMGMLSGCGANGSSASSDAPAAETNLHSWEIAPEPIADADIASTVETEVLVIGGGYSGTCTAASAAEQGLKVILVEKDDVLNGHGVGGTGALGSRMLDQYTDYHIDKPINAERWIKTCGGRCRESLVARYFSESERCMNWLLDISDADGAQCLITANASNSEVHKEEHSYHMIVGGAIGETSTMANACEYRFEAYAKSFGAEFVYKSPVVQLVQDESGRVIGAICETEGGYVKYLADKGVVLATGDISYNDEMLEYFAPIGTKVMTRLCGDTGNVGDGHKMALWAGGAFQDGPWPTMMHPQAGAFFHGPFMFVSPEGKRFMNEGTWVQGKCVGIMTQAKSDFAWSVFDKNWQTDLINGLPYGGGMFWDSFRMFGTDFQDAVDYFTGVVTEGIADGSGNYLVADTLEELAAAMGIPTEEFLAQTERYNTMCAAGEDTDFYKEQVFLTPVKEGPFYACKIGTGLLAVVGGVHISDNNEVLSADDTVVEGLYAVGNVSGDMYAYDYPINIQGNSHGRCLVGGKLLGEYLATV
ncbi:MAG: FAD-dependent oxidoreductase [Actinobacteria bacterium]|nr:FAD-dependent oxidoreductase [Actinomycetota bacterium]